MGLVTETRRYGGGRDGPIIAQRPQGSFKHEPEPPVRQGGAELNCDQCPRPGPILPQLIAESGIERRAEVRMVQTATGSISLFSGRKPA
jgi:hypothetical protein